MGEGQVRHLAAREPRGRALPVLVSMRFAYFVVLRVFGWLALLAHLDRVELDLLDLACMGFPAGIIAE